MVGFRLSRVLPFFVRSRFKGDGRRPAETFAPPEAVVDHDEFQEPDCVGILSRQPQTTACCHPFLRRGSRRWSPPSSEDDLVEGDIPLPPPAGEGMADRFSWSKEGKYWHVVACHGRHVDVNEELLPSSPRQKIDSDDGSVIFPPLDTRRRDSDHSRRRRRESATERKRLSRLRLSRSNSSPDDYDDDEDSGWFSADEENEKDNEETEKLISKADVNLSAEINAAAVRKLTGPAGGRDVRRRRGRRKSLRKSMSMADGAAAVRRLVSCASTAVAVRESFAVVKRSQDPRADFRQSMAEMVVEKEIMDPQGLEQLLQCYLSLNSRRHHADIIAAFRDVWDALFPEAA